MKSEIHDLREGRSPSLFHKVRAGGFWVFLLRIVDRAFGIVKIVVTARLLSPEEFGLFGVALLAVTICETFTQSGFEGALIQKKEDVKGYLDTAWTIQVVRGVALFLLLFCLSPVVASFFKTPHVSQLVRVIAVSQLVIGFRNIGVIYFAKELDFGRQFVFQFVPSCIDLMVSMVLLFTFKNVWALVIALLVRHTLTTAWSFVMHDYRPSLRVDWDKARDLFTFGKWALGSGVLYFLLTQGDDLLVGKVLGAGVLGLYLMAYKISNIPTTEITNVISYVTFPAFSKLQHEPVKLRRAYLQVLKVIMFTTFPLALLLFLLAEDFTILILGEQWRSMVPAMKILCAVGLVGSFGATIRPLFYGVGKPGIHTKLSFLHLLVLGCLIYPLTRHMGIVGAAFSVLSAMTLTQLVASVMVIRQLKVSYPDFVKLFIFPSAAAAVMGLCVVACQRLVVETNLWSLGAVGLMGAGVYLGVCIVFSRLLHYDAIDQVGRLVHSR